MRIRNQLALCALALAASVTTVQAGTVWTEDFTGDSGTSIAGWSHSAVGTNPITVESSVNGHAYAAKIPGAASGTSNDRISCLLGKTYTPTASQSLVFSLDFYHTGTNSGARNLVDIRNSAGSNLIAFGEYNAGTGNTFNTGYYQARVVTAAIPSNGNANYFTLDNDYPSSTNVSHDLLAKRVGGTWHHVDITIGTKSIDFKIDGYAAEHISSGTTAGFDRVYIGTGYSNSSQSLWVDNLRLQTLAVPLPASALGGGVLVAGLALHRRLRKHAGSR